MRPRAIKTSSTAALLLSLLLPIQLVFAYQGSSYNEIKQVIFSTPYSSLPHYQVNKKLFGNSGNSETNLLLQAARRTLTIKDDLFDFPQDQKLLQANGICFAGKWVIDKPSPYSGQFRYPTRSPVIARASVALSGTLQSDIRAFGLALKLFPGQDPDKPAPTLNAFVLNSMGGVRSKHVLDLSLDNAPPLGSLPSWGHVTTAYRLLRDLKAADKIVSKTKPDVSFRPVTQLAEYASNGPIVSPTWLRLRAPDELPRVDQTDFRDELRVQHYPQQQLIWLIEVAHDEGRGKSKAQWQPIGKLIFSESITSQACDQRLHFAHPTLRKPS